MSIAFIEIARYKYCGYHQTEKNSVCRVQIACVDSPNGLRYALVILTELPDNHGTSVTNRSDLLATEIAREYELPPEGTVFLERYPTDAARAQLRLPEFARVTFTWERGEASNPQRSHIPLVEAQALAIQYGIEL